MEWQEQHGRHDMPWQKKVADQNEYAYRVWVSEIMLQQTQVQTVIPYFDRWMSRFPQLHNLATADEADVLALWSGLGYYRRAKNLHACAQAVVRLHHGQFPSTASQLATLPGIGRSTAAAIASTVFGERVAILDGNVKRVLARMTAAEPPWQSAELERMLWHEAESRLPDTDLARYTQAMMDLGALVCKPRNPVCDLCPVTHHCKAYAMNAASLYPRPKIKQAPKQMQIFWAVFLSDSGVWLQQQPSNGIWPAMWTPWRLHLDHPPPGWMRKGFGPVERRTLHHQLTHRRLEIEIGIFHWPHHQSPAPTVQELAYFNWSAALKLALPKPVSALLIQLQKTYALPC